MTSVLMKSYLQAEKKEKKLAFQLAQMPFCIRKQPLKQFSQLPGTSHQLPEVGLQPAFFLVGKFPISPTFYKIISI